jgi:hypothetical protein
MAKDTTTKEYQDKVVKEALKRRDVNVKKAADSQRDFLQDAYDKTYNLVKKMTKNN